MIAYAQIVGVQNLPSRGVEENGVIGEIIGNKQLFVHGLAHNRDARRIRHGLSYGQPLPELV